MIKTLPKIIISVAALFGMFINLHLIHTLSDHSAVSGVEELLSLRMYDWSQSVSKKSDLGGFVTFSILRAVIAAYVASKFEFNLEKALYSIIATAIISGFVLGGVQNAVVSHIGTSLVEKYPAAAKRAISTYYVQRLAWRDNGYKNVLIPEYSGDNIRTIESKLFSVNMFYLVEDPLFVTGDKTRGKDLMALYFNDAVDAQVKQQPWGLPKDNWIYEGFVREFDTAHYDLRRVNNTVVVPVVLATTIFSLILSILVFIGEVFGLAGGSWLKIRVYAVAGVAIALLVTPLFVQTHYHLTPAIQQFNCSYSYCNLAQPVIDWLFRFELGVVKLISFVT